MTILLTGGDRPLGDSCRCVNCADCRGSGREWTIDDWSWLEQFEPCLGCDGSGIVEECDHCALVRELEEDRRYEA